MVNSASTIPIEMKIGISESPSKKDAKTISQGIID